MIPQLDLIGSQSGSKQDKFEVFAWEPAENSAPIPQVAPLSIACTVVDNCETDTFDNFICSIDATLVEEGKLDDKGKPDYELISPVLFEFPTYSYFATGEKLGSCLATAKR